MATIVPTTSGALAVARHGLGVQMRGTYTPHEIYNEGMRLSSTVRRSPDVEFFDGYYQYAWCPWDRFSLAACTAAVERTRMITQVSYSKDDVHSDYAGTGKAYKDTWHTYYPVNVRALTLRKALGSLETKRVLDLGCAGGRALLQLHSYGVDCHGLEANVHHVHEALELLRDRVVLGDALLDTYIFEAGSFDAVICSVLGMIAFPDVQHLFRECNRILVQGGVLILDMPNKGSFNIGRELEGSPGVYSRTLNEAKFRPIATFRQQLLARKK